MNTNAKTETQDERPSYRFAHDSLPHALAPFRKLRRWVGWTYEWRGGKWTKPPHDPHTGRKASVSDPATWGTFDEAVAAQRRNSWAGIGIVLTDDDNLTGIDLDDVINDAGLYSLIAVELLEYAETYAEVSPSGEGVRIMALGKVPNASKNDDIGVEIYGKGRYLTITGDQIPGTPSEIRPAPRTIARVLQAVARKPNGNAAPAPRATRLDSSEIQRAADALRSIPSDDRKVWLDVGMGLQDGFGDAGFSMWHDWSMRSIKFNKADTHTVWRSFKPGGGITIATVFKLARDHGWREEKATDAKIAALDRVAAEMRGYKPAPQQHPQQHPLDLEDFRSVAGSDKYLCMVTGDFWPKPKINAMLPAVKLSDDKVVSAATWLDKNRRITQTTWWPGEPRELHDTSVNKSGLKVAKGYTVYNLYQPPEIRPGNPANAGRWIELVRKIYPGKAEHIIDWFAHRLQKPGEKINHALMLGGAPGIGKDTIIEPLLRAVGEGNHSEAAPAAILGRFNVFFQTVVLRINELSDLGDNDRVDFDERMKEYLAAPPRMIPVEEKFKPRYEVLNCVGVIMTTNHQFTGIHLTDDDRRHFVAWSTAKQSDFPDGYWGRIWSWYDAGGADDVAALLRKRDLSKFNPKAPPLKTDDFLAIVGASARPEEVLLADALDRFADKPPATTPELVGGEFWTWANDRKNRRQVAQCFAKQGYTQVRNPEAKEGHWKVSGRRQVVYARRDLPEEDRVLAAKALAARPSHRLKAIGQ